MVRMLRGRKGKAKKKAAKSASSSAAPSPKVSDCEAVETEIEALEADVVIAPAPEVVQPPPVIRSVVHQAEVIEIRPAAAPKPELPNDDLSLGEWDEPEFQDVPLQPKEPPLKESGETIGELDALQSEIDAMLEDSSLAGAPLVYDEKLQPADRLPAELGDSQSEADDTSSNVLSTAPKTMPEPDAGSTWGGERVGGEGAPEKFYGGKNVLGVIEEIPLIGRILVRDGAWCPLTVFIVIFSLINALIFWLVLSLMVDDEDRLRSVNTGITPTEPAKSVPMEEIKAAVRAFTVAST